VTDTAAVSAAFDAPAGWPAPDAVIHLAARPGVRTSIATPLRCVHTNVFGTAVVFNEAVLRNLSHVVYASSSSVYGVREDMEPFREQDRVDEPASPYAATKAADELLAHAFANVYGHEHGVRFTGLRFFTVYGYVSTCDACNAPLTCLQCIGRVVGPTWHLFHF
jgi:UDP-glucuronate 4-epimerase